MYRNLFSALSEKLPTFPGLPWHKSYSPTFPGFPDFEQPWEGSDPKFSEETCAIYGFLVEFFRISQINGGACQKFLEGTFPFLTSFK